MAWGWEDYGNYVSADEKRRRAGAAARQLAKTGRKLSPVQPAGRSVTESFWGKAWCQNLERYSDYASRLPRGRSYLRQGAVVDLQMTRGQVRALVSGSELYEVEVRVDPLGRTAWARLKTECAGKVGSLIDLLRARLAGPVMEIVTRRETGLFPRPGEIRLKCSCPDHASLCKHVAAVLYGVGARLDEQPELLFTLRGVDHMELIASAAQAVANDPVAPADGGANTLDESSLTEIFGIEIDGTSGPAKAPKRAKRPAGPARVRTSEHPSARDKLPTVAVKTSRPAARARPAQKTVAAKVVRTPQKKKAPARPPTSSRTVRKTGR